MSNENKESRDKRYIKSLVKQYYQIQEHRIAFQNQIRALEEDGVKVSALSGYKDRTEALENDISKKIGKVIQYFPIWTDFLEDVKGVGSTLAAALISEIDIEKAKYPSSLWKYCFTAGTGVHTISGIKNIEDVKRGNIVIDKDGKETKVVETLERGYEDEVLNIKTVGGPDLEGVTKEHPILIYRKDEEYQNNHPQNEGKWTNASDLEKGDFLAVPKIQLEPETESISFNGNARAVSKNEKLDKDISLSEELCEFLGRYLADGSSSITTEKGNERGNSVITIGDRGENYKKEIKKYKEYAESIFGNAHVSKETSCAHIRFGRTTVAKKFIEWFGKRSPVKRVPKFIMKLSDKEKIKSFLKGYVSGDGHMIPAEKRDTGKINCTTSSKSIAFQLQLLFARVGIIPSFQKVLRDKSKKAEETVRGEIQGREIMAKNARYNLNIPYSETAKLYPDREANDYNRKARKIYENENYFLFKIKKIEIKTLDKSVKVYNLKTESNTYLAENYSVHNCGYDVTDDGEGRSRKKKHLVAKIYEDSEGNEVETKGISYNPRAKNIAWKIGKQMMMAKSPYKKIYDERKEYEKNKNEDISDGHAHARALRYMIKQFLKEFHVRWRKLEGLEISEPWIVKQEGHSYDDSQDVYVDRFGELKNAEK